jgi:Fe2+ transport system protein FeoA
MTKKSWADTNSLCFPLESFTFIGGGLEREALPIVEKSINSVEESTFLLIQAKVGDLLHIVGYKGNAVTGRHLSRLGIYPGAVVQVISRSVSGSVIIIVADRQLGLGRQMAQQIMVYEE